MLDHIVKDYASSRFFSEMVLTQPIASLGVAIVGLSEGKENLRIFTQVNLKLISRISKNAFIK